MSGCSGNHGLGVAKSSEDSDTLTVDENVAGVHVAGNALCGQIFQSLGHVQSESKSLRPLDGTKVVVEELAQGAVAGLLEE